VTQIAANTGVIPLVIEFAPGTSVYREPDLISALPIVGNGPPGTFVLFPNGFRVSLPTDQIVSVDDASGQAHVGFGGMQFTGVRDGRLTFARVREMHPEERLSPARSYLMTLEAQWVAAVVVQGLVVWPTRT
jgi:hypothetical protein